MDNHSDISPSRVSNTSVFYSPYITGKNKTRESKTYQHNGSNLEQKLQKLRVLILGYENNYTTEVPIVEPLRPMPYVRHFNVSVSLKKSRPLSNKNSNSKQWATGKRQFNENPKEGFRWLVDNNLIQNTPEHMAAFLINETGLSKRAIGEYLGEKDDFHIEVLKQYAHMHDFFSKDIVEGLRRYLFTFVLPGEAQKIDRIMEAFAQRYYECNPDVYANSEVCFILSFAIIMLNTSLHNKSARLGGTFTYEKFIHSLSEAISRQHMPDSNTLKNIYDNIKNNELKFPVEDISLSNINTKIRESDSPIIKEGWIWKQGGRVRNWKRRWFVLTDGCLYYYESRTDIDNVRGMVPLINIGVRETEDDRTKPFCFELFPLAGEKVKSSKPTPNEAGKMTEGNHSVYRLSATTEDERKEWIRAIRFGSQNELPKQRINEEQTNPDSFAASLNDSQFLRDLLRALPGVDVDSDAVRAALEQVQQQQKKDDDNSSTKKKDEK